MEIILCWFFSEPDYSIQLLDIKLNNQIENGFQNESVGRSTNEGLKFTAQRHSINFDLGLFNLLPDAQ